MAELKRVVFFGVEEGGNQAPLTGFTKLKVKNTAGAVLEANKAWNSEPNKFLNAEVQSCYFVTVIANTNEEAVKVVDALVSGNVDPVANSVIEGPKLGGNINGKYGVVVATEVEEITAMP